MRNKNENEWGDEMVLHKDRVTEKQTLVQQDACMKRVRYELTRQSYMPVAFYGIVATVADEESVFLSSISSDRDFVIGIVDCLNHNEVSLLHFLDVVYDYLCEEFSLVP